MTIYDHYQIFPIEIYHFLWFSALTVCQLTTFALAITNDRYGELSMRQPHYCFRRISVQRTRVPISSWTTSDHESYDPADCDITLNTAQRHPVWDDNHPPSKR